MTAAVAQAENLYAEVAGWANLTDDAMDAKANTIDFESHLELVADHVAGGEVRLNQAAIEAEIQDAPLAHMPVLNAKVDGTATRVARCLPSFSSNAG